MGYYWSLVRRQVCTLSDLEGFNLELDQKTPQARRDEEAEKPSGDPAPVSPVKGCEADQGVESPSLSQADDTQKVETTDGSTLEAPEGEQATSSLVTAVAGQVAQGDASS